VDAPLFAHVSETLTLHYTLRRNHSILCTHAHPGPFRRFHRQTLPDFSWFLFPMPWFLILRAFTGPASWFLFTLTKPVTQSPADLRLPCGSSPEDDRGQCTLAGFLNRNFVFHFDPKRQDFTDVQSGVRPPDRGVKKPDRTPEKTQ
jgi:hypothetical protein